jgi:hypothetical protein
VVVGVDQRRHAVALLPDILGGFANAGAGKIADRLRSVLIAARSDDGVELVHQRIVKRDRHSLHRRAPRSKSVMRGLAPRITSLLTEENRRGWP